MGIILTGEPGIRLPRRSLTRTGKQALSILGCDDRSLSVALVKGRTIKELNKNYRRKNYQTDVLSFNSPPEIAEPFGYMGDIFICVDTAKKNAKLDGHTLDEELILLLVHGILHLFGYKHEGRVSSKDAEKMFFMQSRILAEVLGRGRIGRNKKQGR